MSDRTEAIHVRSEVGRAFKRPFLPKQASSSPDQSSLLSALDVLDNLPLKGLGHPLTAAAHFASGHDASPAALPQLDATMWQRSL
jgi:hypothetical protein